MNNDQSTHQEGLLEKMLSAIGKIVPFDLWNPPLTG
jgi:hypothetical protein